MFVCVCSLCVDTLWHVKFTQPSALISRAQDEVEQVANKFCAENTAMGSLTLSAADKTALEAFAGCAAAGEVGGVTLKKFSANAAKKCIVAEYIVGGGGAKKDSVSASGFVPHHLLNLIFRPTGSRLCEGCTQEKCRRARRCREKVCCLDARQCASCLPTVDSGSPVRTQG